MAASGTGIRDQADDHPAVIVSTENGRLQGTIFRSTSSPNPVYTFLGVPFGKPPVGNLRLALPEPVEPWEGVRDATVYGPGFPHAEEMIKKVMYPMPIPETPMSEDCLYLDIHSPDLKGKRAVLVFIHGGGFTNGKNSDTSGIAWAAHGDIVSVCINYRIGPMGFLKNFGDNKPWPSNLGLRDQQLALHWVQKNIAAFGGDPDRVTLGGESAGSISTSIHLLCPSSRGLFHRAIMQSASIFTVVTSATPALTARALDMLGCANLSPNSTLSRLRGLSMEEILESHVPGIVHPDDELVVRDPEEACKAGRLAKVDLLIGVVKNEGEFIAGMIVPELSSPEPDLTKVKEQLRTLVADYYGHNLVEIEKEILDFYFGGEMASFSPDLLKQKIGAIVAALILTAPTHLTAQYHADHVENTYFYRFDYAASFLKSLRPHWHSGGCDHGFELIFTTGLPQAVDFLPKDMTMSEEDIAMGKTAVQYWANFVKTGNPNSEGLVEWKPFSRQDESYLILKPKPEQACGYCPEEMAFWNTKIRNLGYTTS